MPVTPVDAPVSPLLSTPGAVAAEGVDAGVAAHYGDPGREQRLLEEGLAVVDLSHRGVPVDFFGHRSAMPPGPAALAAATGAPLLPLGCWFTDDGGWGFRIHPAIEVSARSEVPAATQTMADAFASEIVQRPQDWHMLQRIWPDLG